AANRDLGMESGDGGEGAGADADGGRPARQAGAARSRPRSVRRPRRAAEDVRRSRLLVAQRDVGEEPAAAVSRVARVADAGYGQQHQGRHAAARILMVRERTRIGPALGALVLVLAAGAALAQVRFDDFARFGRRRNFTPMPNVSYDGRFTFVRV